MKKRTGDSLLKQVSASQQEFIDSPEEYPWLSAAGIARWAHDIYGAEQCPIKREKHAEQLKANQGKGRGH